MRISTALALSITLLFMACNSTDMPTASKPNSTAAVNDNSLEFQSKTYTIPALPYKAKYTFKSVFLGKGDMAIVNKINAAIQENEKQAIVMNYGNDVFQTAGKSTQDLINEEVQKWHNDFDPSSQNDADYEGYTKEISYTGKVINNLVIVEKDFYSMLGIGVRDHREKAYLVFDAKTGKQLKGGADFFNNPKAVENIINPLFTEKHGLIFDDIEGGVIFMLPENIVVLENQVLFLYTSKELGYNKENIAFTVDKALLKDYLLY